MIPTLQTKEFNVIMPAMTATNEQFKQIYFTDKFYSSLGALVSSTSSKLVPTAAWLVAKEIGIDQRAKQKYTRKAERAPKSVTIVSCQINTRFMTAWSMDGLTERFRMRRKQCTRSLTPAREECPFREPDVTDPRTTGRGVATGL